MGDLPRCRRATWTDLERWADRIADRVRAARAVPETIVGLTRGGWVPARMLSDRLGVKRLVSLRAQHWGVTATRDGAASVTEGLSGPIRGESVLVVDDITDTGESLRLAFARVTEGGPRSAESAAFLHIAGAAFVPTYFAEEIRREEWAWIVFPWNYWEDLRALATRAAELAPGIDPVRATLRSRCGLDVSRDDVARALGEAGTDGPPR
ncbi:MAG TPA: phosphoribosyltransferase [Thermoplasmata archaeon]|nr:phosphoribosyltransferase [Thermoplasmata archaeon]